MAQQRWYCTCYSKRIAYSSKIRCLGEKLDDLQPFNPESYVYGLFADMIEQNDNIPDEMQSLTDNNEEHQNGEK